MCSMRYGVLDTSRLKEKIQDKYIFTGVHITVTVSMFTLCADSEIIEVRLSPRSPTWLPKSNISTDGGMLVSYIAYAVVLFLVGLYID